MQAAAELVQRTAHRGDGLGGFPQQRPDRDEFALGLAGELAQAAVDRLQGLADGGEGMSLLGQ
jgi:hypothetical protein